jgi:hypothetical protein
VPVLTAWLRSDVTGWALASSLVVAFVVALAREWIVLRHSHNRLIAAEATKAEVAEAKTAVEAEKTAFFREAHKIERERNDVLTGGLVAMVTEIRRAVGDPKREPSL